MLDDESDAREQLALVMLDLSDDRLACDQLSA